MGKIWNILVGQMVDTDSNADVDTRDTQMVYKWEWNGWFLTCTASGSNAEILDSNMQEWQDCEDNH